jgi:hypothetical protein
LKTRFGAIVYGKQQQQSASECAIGQFGGQGDVNGLGAGAGALPTRNQGAGQKKYGE